MADDEATNPPSHVETELDREIGLLGALALGVGTMIAAGIFVLSGLAVGKVGAMAIVAFVLAGIVASFTAAAYAEFASIYQESGGGYMYVANTFRSNFAYIMGWTMMLGYPASAAFYMLSFSDWFHRFISPLIGLPETVPFWLSGLLVVLLLTIMNVKGTEESSKFQVAVTAAKVALIMLFLYGGLRAFDGDVVSASFAEHAGAFGQIGLTSALVFITFFGFSAIATSAEDIKQPARTVPRAIYLSMGIVTVIYTLVVLVVVLAVNDAAFLTFLADKVDLAGLDPRTFVETHGEISMGLAAQYYLGDVGFYVIIAGALVSMLSAANATIMAGSRVKLAMGRREHLPKRFGTLHPRFNTPHRTVMLTAALILTYMIVFGVMFGRAPGDETSAPLFGLELGIEGMAQYANFLLLTGLSVVNVALIWSRRKSPTIERGFRVPFVPVVPIIAILANLALLANVGVTAMVLGIIAELAGVAFFFAWKVQPPPTEDLEAETPTALAEYRSEGKEWQVLVSVANPAHVRQLMGRAIDLARDNDGEILVMSVVTLPEQTPLSEGHKYTAPKRDVIEQAMAVAEEAGVPVSGLIRIGHRAEDAIVNTVDQYDSDAVLIGWHGRPSRRRDIVLGTTVDHVAQHAACPVLVEKIGEAGNGVDSILLPTAGGPHAELAAQVAGAIARSTGAGIDVVTVVAPGADEDQLERAQEVLDAAAEGLGEADHSSRMLESDDVIGAIVDAAGGHDLTIIGATREGLLQRLVFGDIPEAVGSRVPGAVIMAKRNLGIQRVKRWLVWRR